MPRYFFNIEDGKYQPDRDGIELDGLRTAQRSAVKLLSEWLHDNPDAVLDTGSVRVIVSDTNGARVFALNLAAWP